MAVTTVAPSAEKIAQAETSFSKAAYALLAFGKNNFDLIKLVRIEAEKVRWIRRAERKPIEKVVLEDAIADGEQPARKREGTSAKAQSDAKKAE